MTSTRPVPALWWSLPPALRARLGPPLSGTDPSGDRTLLVALRGVPLRLLEVSEGEWPLVDCRLWELRKGGFRELAGERVPLRLLAALAERWMGESVSGQPTGEERQ